MPINAFSNYDGGFNNGVTLRKVPVLTTHKGNVWWVNSATGSNSGGADGSIAKPFADTAYALTRCTANNGDLVIWAPGHAETIATATALDFNVAGVSFLALGSGAQRPTFTVGTLAAATVTISAANVSIEGFPIFLAALDGLNSTITLTGANACLDIEHQDTSASVEADIAITVTGDKPRINLRDIGFTGGDQRDYSITLNAVENARIDIDFYGKVATAVVDQITTASTDTFVTGKMYVSGTTDGSKNVLDTATGSTWYMDVIDYAAGSRYTGGSGANVASDDISAVNTVLGTVASAAATGAVTSTDVAMAYIKQLVTELQVVDEFHDVPAADNTLNAQINEVIGNKTDAAAAGAVTTTDTLVGYVKQLVTELAVVDEFHDVPSADATENAQINEVVGNKTDAAQVTVGTTRSLMGYQKGLMNSTVRTIEKTDGAVLNGKDSLFTITGGPIHVRSLIGVVTTIIGGVVNGTLQADVTEPAGTVALSTTVAIDNDAAGTIYTFLGPTAVLTPTTAGASILDMGTVVAGGNSSSIVPAQWIVPIGDINFLGSAAQTGVIKWYMTYEPLSPSAVVTAAA